MPVAGEINEFGQRYFPGLGWSGGGGQGGYTGPNVGSFADQGFAGVGGVPNLGDLSGGGATRTTSTPNPGSMGPAPVENPMNRTGNPPPRYDSPQNSRPMMTTNSGGGSMQPLYPTSKVGNGGDTAPLPSAPPAGDGAGVLNLGAQASGANGASRADVSNIVYNQSMAQRNRVQRPANEPNENGGQGRYSMDGASRWMAGIGQDEIPVGDPSTWNFGNGDRDPNTLVSRGLVYQNAQGQWVTPRYNIRGNFRNESQFGGPVHNGAYALIGAAALGGMGLGALGGAGMAGEGALGATGGGSLGAGAGLSGGGTIGVGGAAAAGAGGLAATGGGSAGVGAPAGVGVTGGSATIPIAGAGAAGIDPITGEPYPDPAGPEGGSPPEGGDPPPGDGSNLGATGGGTVGAGAGATGAGDLTGGTSGFLNNPLTRFLGPLVNGVTGGGGSSGGANRGSSGGGFNIGDLIAGGIGAYSNNQEVHNYQDLMNQYINRGDYNSAYRPGYLASLSESYTDPDKFLAPYKAGDERDQENLRRKLGAGGFNVSGNELGELTMLQGEQRQKHLMDIRNDMRNSASLGHPEVMMAAGLRGLPDLFQARSNRNAAAGGLTGALANQIFGGRSLGDWLKGIQNGDWSINDLPQDAQQALIGAGVTGSANVNWDDATGGGDPVTDPMTGDDGGWGDLYNWFSSNGP